MGITIKELSKISGYSCATISRVIANKGNVKRETQEAIEKLLMEYNYRTNIMELRSLEMKQKTIMIIVGDLNNYFYTELIRVAKTEALRQRYVPLIAFSEDSIEEEAHYVDVAVKEGYAGIMFINVRGGDELASVLKQYGIPVVFLNRGIRFSDFDAITSDNYLGGYMATSYLIEMGHKKIGHIMGHVYSAASQERRRGFEDAMEHGKLCVTKNNIYVGELSYESGYSYGEHMIKNGLDYTAVFCGNDLMADGLLDALRDYGVRVPDDISIVCYDDTFFSKRARVTSVGADAERLAWKAMRILMAKIEGEMADEGSVVYRPKLVVRDSVKKI